MSISMFFAIDFVWATNKNMDLSIRFYLVVNNGFFRFDRFCLELLVGHL